MKKLVLAALGFVLFGALVGGAWATFTGTNIGTGSAVAGTVQSLSLVATTTNPTVALVPGAKGDATFEITNSNGNAMVVVSVVANGPLSVSGGTGCTTFNDAVTFSNQTTLSLPIPASVTDHVVQIPNAVSMGVSSANGCQGATFSIPVLVTVEQQ